MKIIILLFLVILIFYLYSIRAKEGFFSYSYNSAILPSSTILPYKFSQDTDVDKPIRNNVKYYTIKKELSPKKLEGILKEIMEENQMSPEYRQNLNLITTQKPKSLKEYKLMRDFLISQISDKSEEFKSDYAPHRNFKFLNENILSYKIDKYKQIEQVEFNIRIYRQDKNKNFVIYVIILLDSETMNYYVQELSILSTNIEENVVFNREKDFISTNSGQCLTNDTNCDNKLSESQITEILEKREELLKDYKIDKLNRCFYKEGNDRLECISYDKENDVVGVWDKPCVYDEECPFYKKNKNYTNERGGCKNGYCEMPLNVNNIGFRFKGKRQPLCHNCPREEECIGLQCAMCCNDQELPDYAFEKDYKERQEHLDELNSKDLSVFDIRIM
jgi:hypothetical protein